LRRTTDRQRHKIETAALRYQRTFGSGIGRWILTSPDPDLFRTRHHIAGGAGLDTAKIATIAWHSARLIYPREGTVMVCINPLFGRERSLYGSAGFPLHGAGKIPPNLCPK
jgi:hypothetical protein